MAKGERIPGYDPESIKLFSKCARDHAARNSSKKSARPSAKNSKSSIITIQQTKKTKKTLCSFDMCQSREQRDRKYLSMNTPAVGQYNAQIQRDRPKLTWDILKIYHQRCGKKRMPNTHIERLGQNSNRKEGETQKNESLLDINRSQIQTQFSVELSPVKNIGEKIYRSSLEKSQNVKKLKTEKQINQSETQAYKTIKSQVDMSRMVGRKQTQNNRYNNENSTQVDLSRSTDFVKPSNNKRYSFKQQISREKANQALGKPLVVAADYSFDYKTVKPKKTSYVSFAKSVGRKDTDKSTTLDPPYSYTHYQYDNYVWNGRSNIFSNTKTHMMDFKKQTNRSNIGK